MRIENTLRSPGIELRLRSRQSVNMQGEDALQDSFRLACLASCYFGGRLVKVNNWLPGLTLRVHWLEGSWLEDLPSPAKVAERLNGTAVAFDARWHVIRHNVQEWLESPYQRPIHHVELPGQSNICWTDRVLCMELPVMELDACWPGLPPLSREVRPAAKARR